MKLSEHLNTWTSDTLKTYIDILGVREKPLRKADRVDLVCRELLSPETLQQYWGRLDTLSRQAVSEAWYNGGNFNATAFIARHGKLPERPQPEKARWWVYRTPILVDLLIISQTVPSDLMPLLEPLVLPVEPFRLSGSKEPPTDVTVEGESSPVRIFETERAGQADLLTFLQLVDQGGLKWSTTQNELTAAAVRKLYGLLLEGDFVAEPESVAGKHVIRPFGLDVFARNAGLVTSTGKLTGNGRKYLQSRDPDLLLAAFEKWAGEGKFDELARIAQLRGAGSKTTRLTKPAGRREKVIEALSWCPVNEWIWIDDFFRALQIWDFDFEVEIAEWGRNLYVGSNRYYGELDGRDYWLVTNGLLIKAILVEYLATIGAVDIALLDAPYSALELNRDPLEGSAYSLHDPLVAFSINNLGAFLLGQADAYVATEPRRRKLFVVDEKRRLTAVVPPLPNELLQLNRMGEQIAPDTWQLSADTLLTLIESGQKFSDLQQFLLDNHQGTPPHELIAWLKQLKTNLNAFVEGEEAVIIQVTGATARALVQEDQSLAGLCQVLAQTGNTATLLVTQKKMAAFRKRLRELEYLPATNRKA